MYANYLLKLIIIALLITSARVKCEIQKNHNDDARLNEILSAPHLVQYIQNIKFYYYNTNGTVQLSVSLDQDVEANENCKPNQKFAIIVHGWRESCDVEWAKLLVNNLNRFRGGCVLCMDYSFYATGGYRQLVTRFETIVPILLGQLISMTRIGFNPDQGYMFGFSFGARLVSTAGQNYGARKLKEVDLCDIAGPGFDYRSQAVNHSLAAQNVQCIRTSGDKGTKYSTCDQDWKMGICGIMQIAAGDPPMGSHGLCPYFYNAAFEFDFLAIEKPEQCSVYNTAVNWPLNYKMGYMEERKVLVRGELFADTTAEYPYTNTNNRIETEFSDYLLKTSSGEYKPRKRFSRIKLRFANVRRHLPSSKRRI